MCSINMLAARETVSNDEDEGGASPRISILIVSYNTRDLTVACLRSVYAETRDHPFEVIVLDNASTDGSAEATARTFPQARLITSKTNHGFAGGNNIAAQSAQGAWILLLNPDTVVKDRAIDRILDFAEEHPKAAIFGSRTVFADGTLNPTSCWARPSLWSSFCNAAGLASLFRGSRFFDPEGMGNWKRDTAREVDIVTGCFFLLRRSDWERLQGFDPRFFMYGEETDLCLRAARQGLRCMICPDAEIVHYGGASEKVQADKMVRLFRAKSQLYAAHWDPVAAHLGIFMLDLWALVRIVGFAAARAVGAGSAESVNTWCKIWRNRQSWHLKPEEILDHRAQSAGASPYRAEQE